MNSEGKYGFLLKMGIVQRGIRIAKSHEIHIYFSGDTIGIAKVPRVR